MLRIDINVLTLNKISGILRFEENWQYLDVYILQSETVIPIISIC